MNFLVISIGILFTLFSTVILSYVSMATMVGPWIAPTLVLLGHCLYSFTKNKKDQQVQDLAIMQAIGAGGGIIATGIGFALPLLYFLDETTFTSMVEKPLFFCGIIGVLCLIAGALGLWYARWDCAHFLDTSNYRFPVSELTYNVITSHAQPHLAKNFMLGSLGTLILCFLRDGFLGFKGFIAKTYFLFPSFLGSCAVLSIWPTLWAIGFSVGISTALPLFVGLIAKYIVIYPLANHALFLPFKLFEPMSSDSFSIAFCSGLIVSELLLSMPGYIKKWRKHIAATTIASLQLSKISWLKTPHLLEFCGITSSIFLLLRFFSFPFLAQVCIVLFTLFATKAICQIAGKIGMLPFGRFSTFIIVPLLLIFRLNAVQVTIVCVFFDVCAATASDLLFDYKIGDLCCLNRKDMYKYQWIGLIATAASVGIIFWLLFTNLHLGSEALFAQRSKAKALLLQSLCFDKYIVFCGVLFGWLLKRLKLSPTMVFGGLIMPNTISIGLILGGIGTKLVKKPDNLQSLCAGILACESLWTIITILVKTL
ncbi:MAG: hypothetical protein WC365_06495 [Candidatus Babeliales bacterium]|jgi:hypothetical protein